MESNDILELQNNSLERAFSILHEQVSLNTGFRYHTDCDKLPHSILLKDNAIFRSIIETGALCLSHQTQYLSEIGKTGVIKLGWGCLGKALYTIPNYILNGTTVHDNFFDIVLSHQLDESDTRHEEIVIFAKISDVDYIWGTNYLYAGLSLTGIAENTLLHETDEYALTQQKVESVINSPDFHRVYTSSESHIDVLNSMATLARRDMFFAYIYYEVISQVVMLSATDSRTIAMRDRGQFNAACYYELLATYAPITGSRFDAATFAPRAEQVADLLSRMAEPSVGVMVDKEFVMKQVAVILNHTLHNIDDKDGLSRHLFGQFLRSELSSDDSQKLMHDFNRLLHKFRLHRGIQFVINTATFKPEIGLISDSRDVSYYTSSVRNFSAPKTLRYKLEQYE